MNEDRLRKTQNLKLKIHEKFNQKTTSFSEYKGQYFERTPQKLNEQRLVNKFKRVN